MLGNARVEETERKKLISDLDMRQKKLCERQMTYVLVAKSR
jgi:hypothetical protein